MRCKYYTHTYTRASYLIICTHMNVKYYIIYTILNSANVLVAVCSEVDSVVGLLVIRMKFCQWQRTQSEHYVSD